MKVHEKKSNDKTVYNLFHCEHCSKSFSTNNHLKQHMLIHAEEKSHQCQHCDKSFYRKDHLTSHMKVHNKSHVKAQEACQSGSESFSDDTTVHKLFHCEHCSKAFPSNYRLKRHMLIHSKNKPHQCQQCSKSFSRKESFCTYEASQQISRTTPLSTL